MNLKKLSDEDYKKMSQEITEYRANARMTKKEYSDQDISGYSALPLVTMFIYWPVGAVAGALIGATAGAITGAGILAGLAMGIAGGSVAAWGTGIGQFVLGHRKAENVEKNFHKRIEKDVKNIKKRYLKKDNKFNFSIGSLFNRKSKKPPEQDNNKPKNNLSNKKSNQNKPK